MVLMATAFMDMVGLLMVIPLLPFYVKKLGGEGVDFLGMHLGIGILSGLIASAFTVAQLLSSPMWGRFSDKFGRRPALLIALSAAGVAYLVFGFAESLWLLFLSRIVQGAGGGSVGVIQAYVANTARATWDGCQRRRISVLPWVPWSAHSPSCWARRTSYRVAPRCAWELPPRG
jgi:MFS family permease